MKILKYQFYEVSHCNMCGAPSSTHKILGQRLNQSQGFRPRGKTGISVSVMQCRNCDLIYSNPQPVPENLQDHYGIPPESYWKGVYFKPDPEYFSKEIAQAKKLLPFQPGMKALDVGAGLGKCMISLSNAGFDAYGFEPSEPFYERALSEMKINPERLKKGMIEEMDYEANSFDFITFGAVLEHFYDADKAIAKAMKWLKPEGLLHIEVPSSRYLIGKLINFYFRLIGTNYVVNISPMHTPFHMYEFGLKSFKENQKKNNFTIAHYQYYVGQFDGMPRILNPFLNWYMTRTNTGMQLTIWLKKNTNSAQ
jgi:2-polyprenyl-3-methyl-5-hydroxy-6-metoxy-1,4-benzoquinol methylase